MINKMQTTNCELLILKFFYRKTNPIALSPKHIDHELQVGIERVIDLFLDLEMKGLVKWCSLDLLQLNLERSTKEIYQEVYNSLAQITHQGSLMVERYMSEGTVA